MRVVYNDVRVKSDCGKCVCIANVRIDENRMRVQVTVQTGLGIYC